MELTFKDLAGRIYRIRRFLLGLPLLTTFITGLYWYQKPDLYRATTTLIPSASTTFPSFANTEDLSTLTQLSGIQLGIGTDKQTDIALALLQSQSFIVDFIARRDIKVPLLAVIGWDPDTLQYHYDTNIYSPDTRQWVRRKGPQTSAEPTATEAYLAFVERFQVNYKNDTKAVTLAFTHPAAPLAAQWLNWLVVDLNETMRQREIESANQSLAYLEKQLTDTSLTQIERVLYQLVESETQRKYLANIQPNYAFTTIDPATTPPDPIAPKRITYCLLSLLFSSTMCVMVVFFLPPERTRHYS